MSTINYIVTVVVFVVIIIVTAEQRDRQVRALHEKIRELEDELEQARKKPSS